MYILGLNAYHWDSSACIFKDGTLIAASEEERFNRIKHWSGLPLLSIEFCLNEAGIKLTDVDYIATAHDPKAKLMEKVWYGLTRSSADLIKRRLGRSKNVQGIVEQVASHFGFTKEQVKAKFCNIEHHRSHLASAFFASPFDEAALLSLDAFGDFTSTMRGVGKGNTLNIIDSVSYPHSLGMFYTAMTQFLGFHDVGDEYKVMGLAPYGKPTYVNELKKIVKLEKNGLFKLEKKYFSYFRDGVILEMRGTRPYISQLFSSALSELFGDARSNNKDPLTQHHKDIAASVQQFTEEVIFHVASDLRKKTGLPYLCIAGGVAQNSVANGKIASACGFDSIYIPSAGHDAGLSMGSAMYVYYQQLQKPRSGAIWSAYTGSHFSNQQIEEILKKQNIQYRVLQDEQIYELVTEKLINNCVVGWFNGRAEFGPRALGGRSILADPRNGNAKELLNSKIKRRESFRPFAPSILKEYTAEYFTKVDEVPFMEKVFPIKPEKHAIIPAVTHVDGTGRLQTVDKNIAPRYYNLIERFRQKTGVPILLNTSFNENEPIVNTPQEALDCFLRTNMDVLVLENCIIERGQHLQ